MNNVPDWANPDSVTFKLTALVFFLIVGLATKQALYVARGFRNMPTSSFGLLALRVIAAVSIVQIIASLMWPHFFDFAKWP